MPKTICDVCDEVKVFSLRPAKESVNGLDDHFDDVDVLPFIKPSYVVSLSDLAVVEDCINGTRMGNHIEPVTHIFSLSVDRERFAMEDVVDKEWYQLLWELIWTLVVGTVGHDGWHAIGVMERTHEMVAAGL